MRGSRERVSHACGCVARAGGRRVGGAGEEGTAAFAEQADSAGGQSPICAWGQ